MVTIVFTQLLGHLPVLALIVSSISLCISLYVARRDRSRLHMKTRIEHGWGERPPVLWLWVTNTGRRPIVLLYLVPYNNRNSYGPIQLGDDKQGLKLLEGQRHTLQLRMPDVMYGVGNEIYPTRLYFENTHGRRYWVQDSKRDLKSLFILSVRYADKAISRDDAEASYRVASYR